MTTEAPISETLQARLHRTGAITLLGIDELDDAMPLARALGVNPEWLLFGPALVILPRLIAL